MTVTGVDSLSCYHRVTGCMKALDVAFFFFWTTQTEVVTSMKALMKMVDESQRTSRLDGTLSYNHCDWLELHQVSRQAHPSPRAGHRGPCPPTKLLVPLARND